MISSLVSRIMHAGTVAEHNALLNTRVRDGDQHCRPYRQQTHLWRKDSHYCRTNRRSTAAWHCWRGAGQHMHDRPSGPFRTWTRQLTLRRGFDSDMYSDKWSLCLCAKQLAALLIYGRQPAALCCTTDGKLKCRSVDCAVHACLNYLAGIARSTSRSARLAIFSSHSPNPRV